MNSAYSIFKRPYPFNKDRAFSGSSSVGFQAQVHYTPNLAQEINLSRIQRQLIADKCSFDGGMRPIAVPMENWRSSQPEPYGGDTIRDVKHGFLNQFGHGPKANWDITFRAALTGRCFSVEKSTGFMETVSPSGSAQINGTNDTNQLDRKTDCYRKGYSWLQVSAINESRRLGSKALEGTPEREAVRRKLLVPFTVAVCGTQTKQGGCLYESARSQENCYVKLREMLVRCQPYSVWLRYLRVGHIRRTSGGTQRQSLFTQRPSRPMVGQEESMRYQNIWQKPGIGVRPSVRSSSLKALPRGKDSQVLSGMTPRALCYRPVRLPTEERGGAMDKQE